MYKQKIAGIISILLVAIMCLSLFAACKKIDRIEETQVQEVILWVDGKSGEYTLNEEQVAKVIELYNTSKYEGEGIGDGGTPQFQFCVYFRNGAYLVINEFDGSQDRDFEVSLYNADKTEQSWYYVSSDALKGFALELVEQVKQNGNS